MPQHPVAHPLRRLATAVALITPIAGARCNAEPKWQGVAISPPRVLPVFSFADSSGRRLSTQPAHGQVTLVFFGYTNCPDVCATALADWVRVRKAMGTDAGRVRFLFVTVDPARDTPVIAGRFVARFDTSFVALSGDSATTAGMQHAFGVASSRQGHAAADYLLAHSSETFLMDDQGRLVASYGFGAGWDAMAADIRQLLD